MQGKTISQSVIRRLPRYYRFLEELHREGMEKISSRELSERMRLTASQIRQDLNCFGGFGQQGYGYNISELKDKIGTILHLDEKRNVILIGVGNLGRAISEHLDFSRFGFELTGVFDREPSIIGRKILNLSVRDVATLREFCTENRVDMAILCIPRTGAQEVVKTLYACGVHAFWNYSHYDILADYPDAAVENVHLTDSLMTLSYSMNEELCPTSGSNE
ncbi:MAG: redox-sensing transcriptional repressor Rex [Oscillospiraceae bacterium]